MAPSTALHVLPAPYSPFGVDYAQQSALASPFQHALGGGVRSGGGAGGGVGVEIGQLPYRQSLLPSHASPAPMHAADVPAQQQQRQHNHHHHHHQRQHQHHPANSVYPHQRGSAAVAAHHAATAATSRSVTAAAISGNLPLQLSSTTLRELHRRELVKRKHYRDVQERDLRDRVRARKLSRAAARASRFYSMEGGAAEYAMGEDELAEMQKLSNDYQPDVTGPDVSERISTEAIAEEYARADPSYQVKTASIPQSYPLYRTCKGDGHCGWRAVSFCYYETLLYLNSKQKYREEETRIRSLTNLLQAVGHDASIYETWEEIVLELLASLASSPSIEEADALLLSSFNDPDTWQSIITFMKTLTSAWIRTRREDYEPFMQGMTAEEYCAIHVDPFQAEIEHVGLSALADCLLKPTGFAMEVHYLDRSAGNEPFVHRFDPADNTGVTIPGTPVIRLLYRPGHYDILYAFGDAAALPQQSSLPASHAPRQSHGDNIVYLASPSDDSPHGLQSTPSSYNHFADGLALIPGLSSISTPSLSGSPGLWMAPPPTVAGQFPATTLNGDYPQGVESHPAPARGPQPQRIAPAPDSTYSHAPALPATAGFGMPAPPTYINASASTYPVQQVQQISAAPAIQHGSIDRSGGPNSSSSIFRPSRFEYESRWSEATLGGPHAHGRDLGFQTSIFRNSHFNIAHFNNPDFEPEQWQPGQESCDKGRRKSMAR